MIEDNFIKLEKDECLALAEILEKKYNHWRKDRSFQVAAYADQQGTFAKVALLNSKRTFYYPVEARINHKDHEMDRREAATFLLDYIDYYFEEFFREGEGIYLPIDWAQHTCEGIAFDIKGQIHNSYLEDLADQLLASSGQVSENIGT
jgi:hypothetical protein